MVSAQRTAQSCSPSNMGRSYELKMKKGTDVSSIKSKELQDIIFELRKGMKMKERKYFTVIDGICGGQGQGPFCPYSKKSNTLIAGEDLLASDCVAARYMGLNPKKIKYLNYFLDNEYDGVTLDNIDVLLNGKNMNNFFNNNSKYLDYDVVEQWKEIKI